MSEIVEKRRKPWSETLPFDKMGISELAMSCSLEKIVSVSPDVMSGTPVFRGTRVPVKNLLDYLAGGDSIDDFLEQFPTVKREQAVALISAAQEFVLASADEPARR